MSDDNIEIGVTPDENASQKVEQEGIQVEAAAIIEKAMQPPKFNADKSTSAVNPRKLTVDSETADKIFGLIPLAHDATNWGYKGLTNQKEREAGARSVAATKHVFAHAYAVDPERAIKKWTEVNGHPPSNALIHAAQTLPLHSPKKALDSLTVNVEKASSQISKITAENRENEIRKRKNSLIGPHGDAVARKKEYQSAIIDSVLPDRVDQSDSGMFIFRALIEASKTSQKVLQSIILKQREKEMTAEMAGLTKDLRSIDSGKIHVTSNKIPDIKQTIGAMGSGLASRVKVPGIAIAAKIAMSRPERSNGVKINSATIASQSLQIQKSAGLAINI